MIRTTSMTRYVQIYSLCIYPGGPVIRSEYLQKVIGPIIEPWGTPFVKCLCIPENTVLLTDMITVPIADMIKFYYTIYHCNIIHPVLYLFLHAGMLSPQYS